MFSRSSVRSACAVVVFVLLGVAAAHAQIVFPSDSLIVDVTKAPYNAVPNDGLDDTAAIQKALDAYPSGNRIIYLPAGVYDVSDTLTWPLGSSGGSEAKRTILQGAGADDSVLRLAPNAPGFGNANNRKGVINTGHAPAQRFRNSIRDLAVSVAPGNPGAAAIQYISNNQGTLSDVKIISEDGSGAVGLDLAYSDEIGPAMFRNVQVDGFNYGIRIGYTVDSMTFENVTLNNQNTAGILHTDQFVALRNLTSTNTVPAIQSTGGGMITLDGATLNLAAGGNAAQAAISIANSAAMFARNVQTTGYDAAIVRGGTNVAGPTVGQFVSHPVLKLFDSPERSLGLPVKPTPDLPLPEPAKWINPTIYGGNGSSGNTGDDTAAIQQAIDNAAALGKTTVYLPNGDWTINGTLHVRGAVERIIGTETRLRGSGRIVIDDGTSDTVVLERIEEAYGTNLRIEQHTDRALLIRNYTRRTVGGYTNTGGGDLFLEDVVGGEWVFRNINVWARQFNVENLGTKIVNDGGNLWILGIKTERGGTIVETLNGGSTEILGALVYATSSEKIDPMFINDESRLSVSIGEACFNGNPFGVLVEETRDGITRQLLAADAFAGYGSGSLMPLYVGYVPEPASLLALAAGAVTLLPRRRS